MYLLVVMCKRKTSKNIEICRFAFSILLGFSLTQLENIHQKRLIYFSFDSKKPCFTVKKPRETKVIVKKPTYLTST
jgi:hypothetical protein